MAKQTKQLKVEDVTLDMNNLADVETAQYYVTTILKWAESLENTGVNSYMCHDINGLESLIQNLKTHITKKVQKGVA